MAHAFKCDKCGEFHEGSADMQVGLDKRGETILRHTLGLKFSPENQEAPVYLKDLCNKCTKGFCAWIKGEYDAQNRKS